MNRAVTKLSDNEQRRRVCGHGRLAEGNHGTDAVFAQYLPQREEER